MDNSNSIVSFSSPEFGEVRTVQIDGEPWFVAADVCRALSISNSRDAVSNLDDCDKGVAYADTLGGKQKIGVINEPGLYALMFRSKKQTARNFAHWVTHEVIPSIRKTGSYSVKQKVAADEIDTDMVIDALLKLRSERDAAVKRVEELSDRLTETRALLPKKMTRDLTNITNTARELGVPRGKFVAAMIDNGFLYRRDDKSLAPCKPNDQGLFVSIPYRRNGHCGYATYVTDRGKDFLGIYVRHVEV